MSLFGVDIAQIVSDALTGQLYPVTLKRTVAGNYNPSTDEETGVTTETFTSEGVFVEFTESEKAAGLAKENVRKLLIIAKPLGTQPRSGDNIEFQGETLKISADPGLISGSAVSKDPASATYTVRVEI